MRRALIAFAFVGVGATCGGTTNTPLCEAGSCSDASASSDVGVKDSAPKDSGADSGPVVCTSTPMKVPYNSIATASHGALDCDGDEKTFAWKNGAPGSSCVGPLDCAPTCCICSTGRAVLTSWCDNGKCADAAATSCALAGTATLSCGDLD